MTTRGMDIPFCLSCDPVSFTSLQKYITVLSSIDDILTQTLNEYPGKLVLSDNQRLWILFILVEIVKFFVIDLEEGAIHCEVQFWVDHAHLRKFIKNFIYGLWYDTEFTWVIQEIILIVAHCILITEIIIPMRAEHCVGLARSSLTVSEYRWIKTP